jgi:serine/threonine protein kinase
MGNNLLQKTIDLGIFSEEQANKVTEIQEFYLKKGQAYSEEQIIIQLKYLNSKQIEEIKNSKTIGNYKIIKNLGEGGMGVVYLAENLILKRTVALKVLTRTGERNIKRFIREAQSIAQLEHSNIIKIYEFGESQGKYFIAMEYIEGEDLSLIHMLKKQPPRKIVEVLIQVCNAIQHAHDQGIIHRDIKPSNVMIRKDGTPVIMDFGLAKEADRETSISKTNEIIGTPVYMSPEQARGRVKSLDARSDIYSIGAMMYELLADKQLFSGAVTEILMDICSKDPRKIRDICPDIPIDLEAICFKAIEKKKEDRYQTAKEMKEDLERFYEGIATKAQAKHSFSVKKWMKKNIAVVVGLFIFLLCMIVFSTYASISNFKLKLVNQRLYKTIKQNKMLAFRLKKDQENLKRESKKAKEAYKKVVKLLKEQRLITKLARWQATISFGKLPNDLNTIKKHMQFENIAISIPQNNLETLYLVWGQAAMLLALQQKDNKLRDKILQNMLSRFIEFYKTKKSKQILLLGYQMTYAFFDEAPMRHYTKSLLQLFPQDNSAYTFFKKGLNLRKKKNISDQEIKQAIKYFQKAGKGELKNFPEVWLEIGDMYRRLNKFKKAQKNIEKAISLRQFSLTHSYLEKAKIYISWSSNTKGKRERIRLLEKAIQACTRAIEHQQFYTIRTYYYRASTFIKIAQLHHFPDENYENAIKDLVFAIQSGYSEYACLRKLKICYSAKDDTKNQLEIYRHLLNLKATRKRKEQWYFERGQVYEKLKKYRYALRDYKQALKLSTDFKKMLYSTNIKRLERLIRK